MSSYKLIALDMDGTLLNQQGLVSEQNRQAIKAALDAGVAVTIATGRGMEDVRQVAQQLGLTSPLVVLNGSELWKDTQVLWERHLLEVAWVKKMRQLALYYDTWFWAYSVGQSFNRDHFTEDIDSRQWIKFGFHTEDDEVRNEIKETLHSWDCLELSNSSPLNIEVNKKGVSKATGLQKVCQVMEIDMSQVIAVGDSLNDKAMICAAGLGVAMGNAQEIVKKEADDVTLSNRQDGVAQVIKEYVL